MAEDIEPIEKLIDLAPDARLLGEDLAGLPESAGHPVPIPPSRLRPGLVGAGAAMTGLTLLIGIALIAVGIGEAVADAVVLAIAALTAGVALAGTHWGWIHVAELGSQWVERRGNRDLVDERERWLASVEPYVRYAVETRALPDGAVEILTTRHRPVRATPDTFTFERQVMAAERHAPDELAATVTERAEVLRQQAAQATDRERRSYQAAASARALDQIRDDDEDERRAADRAAAEALSEQINANLRSPPTE